MIKNRKYGFRLQWAQSIEKFNHISQIKDYFVCGEIRIFIYSVYKNILVDIHLGLVCRVVGKVWLPGGHVSKSVKGILGRGRKEGIKRKKRKEKRHSNKN